ncbi:MAG: N-acetyl-gamma-glutamyl-phosphate reductase [Bacillota bacterium]|nr:N-acetyl-gamma-glutamyl-phosphate reductase [Bacillota bacterium]
MAERTRVAVIGATGYSGVELCRLLLGHPEVELAAVAARSEAGRPLGEVYPHLARVAGGLVLRSPQVEELAGSAELFFLALPSGESPAYVEALRARGRAVIDLAGDLRLERHEEYLRWYGGRAAEPLAGERYRRLRAGAVYGLPELHREELRRLGEGWRRGGAPAPLVLNPGCYPTAAVLVLAPFLAAGWLEPSSLVVDAKSGVTGAGRAKGPDYAFAELDGNFAAYKLGRHQHRPEIAQELGKLAGEPADPLFTAQLLPVRRGILVTAYARLRRPSTERELWERCAGFYREERFVRLLPPGESPQLRDVVGSNEVHLGLSLDADGRRVTLLAALDNLGKGAAGQAVQNMNLLLGLPEAEGIEAAALRP